MNKLRVAVSAAASATVLLSAVGASAGVTSATAVSCGGKTNAQLISGDAVTVSVVFDSSYTQYVTALSGAAGTPQYSEGTASAFVANVPQPVTYTLNETPAGGEIYVFDGTTTAQVTCPAVAAAAIPTMSEWAMILLGLTLAGGAALYIQRRRLEA